MESSQISTAEFAFDPLESLSKKPPTNDMLYTKDSDALSDEAIKNANSELAEVETSQQSCCIFKVLCSL